MVTAAVLPAFGFLCCPHRFTHIVRVSAHTHTFMHSLLYCTYVRTYKHTHASHNGMAENLCSYTLGVSESILGWGGFLDGLFVKSK
jgi:hypothetical protein